MPKKPSSFKEEFARFLEDPSRDRLRDLLKNHHGEQEELDFKQEWPEPNKLVKHILGFANSGGGCMVVGVSENSDKKIECSGILELKDKADIDKQLKKLLPANLMESISVLDFSYADSDYKTLAGKSFQLVLVPDDPANLPFLPIAETTGIRRTVVYVRRMASTEEATYEEFQTVINRRIDTGRSNQNVIDLNKHLEDLRVLHTQRERYYLHNPMGHMVSQLGFRTTLHEPESFEKFTNRMIAAKQQMIEMLLRQKS